MKTYKVCLKCIEDLQHASSLIKYRSLSGAKYPILTCEQKPRCFDQPERSKREDLNCCIVVKIFTVYDG